MSDYTLIPLRGRQAQGRSAKVSVNFAYLATQSPWYMGNNGYVIRWWKGKIQYLHHVVLAGQKGMCIDHINRNPLDNRTENLRLATRSKNARNSDGHKDSQLAVKNVYFDKTKRAFAVRFNIEGRFVWVGRFKTLKEAITKRDEARRAHGY